MNCKFPGDCNGERNFKIGLYLTKLRVEHLGFTFLAHPVESEWSAPTANDARDLNLSRSRSAFSFAK